MSNVKYLCSSSGLTWFNDSCCGDEGSLQLEQKAMTLISKQSGLLGDFHLNGRFKHRGNDDRLPGETEKMRHRSVKKNLSIRRVPGTITGVG